MTSQYYHKSFQIKKVDLMCWSNLIICYKNGQNLYPYVKIPLCLKMIVFQYPVLLADDCASTTGAYFTLKTILYRLTLWVS